MAPLHEKFATGVPEPEMTRADAILEPIKQVAVLPKYNYVLVVS
jgi:hypothetical protein